MHTEPHLVLEDVLNACQTINVFGEHASQSLTQGQPLLMSEHDRLELQEAFTLMRNALDRVQPLVARPFSEMHNWTLHDEDYPFP